MRAFLSIFAKVILADVLLDSKWESMTDILSSYDGIPGLRKYIGYGPGYDENVHHIRERAILAERKVSMLEIGIQSGGSTRVWKRYFRGLTDYVGLDIDPKCRKFQSPEEGIKIFTGSQLDTVLLSKLCNDYGPFDIIVDDGGHFNEMMKTALSSLWSCLTDGGVYVIEDLHTMNMGSHYLGGNSVSIFQEIAEWMRVRSPSIRDKEQIELKTHPGTHLKQMSFSDSLMFLHYGKEVPALTEGSVVKGSHWLLGKREEPERELVLDDWCTDCCIGCYEEV